MEPSDIDDLFKVKLEEAHDTHHREMMDGKPFVWSAVQKNMDKTLSLNWYQLAAAVLLVLIGTYIFTMPLKKQNKEVALLSQKVDLLQHNYLAQHELLLSKNKEVQSLVAELKNVEQILTELAEERQIAQKKVIIYRTDTIYQKQIEYITVVPDTIIQYKDYKTLEETQVTKYAIAEISNQDIDNEIYPSFASRNKDQKVERIKVKFLSGNRR